VKKYAKISSNDSFKNWLKFVYKDGKKVVKKEQLLDLKK